MNSKTTQQAITELVSIKSAVETIIKQIECKDENMKATGDNDNDMKIFVDTRFIRLSDHISASFNEIKSIDKAL